MTFRRPRAVESVEQRRRTCSSVRRTLQVAVRRQHVQPLGKEQVDLARIFPQRGKAGSVPGNVEGRTNAFFRIQLDLRRCIWIYDGRGVAAASFRRSFAFSFSFSFSAW